MKNVVFETSHNIESYNHIEYDYNFFLFFFKGKGKFLSKKILRE